MRATLRRDLTAALKARDRATVAALRSALAAIDNAEAVPVDQGKTRVAEGEHIAGAAIGAGSADVDRHQLTDSDVRAIVEKEASERSVAAHEHEQLGRHDIAAHLRTEVDILSRYLSSDE